jgi:hypothetical protein
MADLNEQLQGLQNQLNSHFQDRQSVTSTDSISKREPDEQEPSLREARETSSSDDSSSCSDDTSDIYYSSSEAEREKEVEEEKVVISHSTAV